MHFGMKNNLKSKQPQPHFQTGKFRKKGSSTRNTLTQ